MDDFRKKFEDVMSAASFAEADDLEAARKMVRGEKKVLLVLTGKETEASSFQYALNVAKRTGAGLEVLVTSGVEELREAVRGYEEKARQEEVAFTVVKKLGCAKEAIIGHATRRSDILFVVVESTAALEVDCIKENRKLKGSLRKIPCPLVLVSEPQNP
ncbi:MAG: hypothetical protein P8Y66_06290 [Nitrospirota bacterium]|jgi:hypothetical protein